MRIIPHYFPFRKSRILNSLNNFLPASLYSTQQDTGTGKKICDELLQIWKSGRAPENFNFSKDIFDRHATHRPTATALWFDNDKGEERKWTFSELQKESIRSAILLNNLLNNEGSSSCILTVLTRIPEWWFLHLAAIRIGSVFCPGTTMLTSEDIEYRLDASKAQMIITDEANMNKIDDACKSLPFPVKKLVIRENNKNPLGKGWIDFHKLLEEISPQTSFKLKETKSEEIAQMYFTSGTTGKPKMVAHTHSSYGVGHFTTVKMLGLQETDIHWNISDPGWAKSSYSNFFAPWTAGSTVYIHQMERFDGHKVLKELSTKPITTFCAPPTLFRSMLQEKDPKLFNFPSLRYCVGAGEPVSHEVSRVWKQKTGVVLHEAYGQTEMTAVDCEISTKEGSIGKANGFLDLRIVDENIAECEPNVEGQVALKVKPNRPIGLFKGYLRKGIEGPEMDTEKNSSVFIGDFYLTGDLAYKDESGHIFLVGRADDVISSSGYRIGPTEIESVLQTHPSVVESAAVSAPDPHRGEIVKAFIILTPEYKKIAQQNEENLKNEIQEYVKKHTAPYKYPRKIEFVETLPKTVSGKILRRELKRLEFQKSVIAAKRKMEIE